MEATQNSWITTVLFEHACKCDFKGVMNNVLEDKDLVSKIQEHSATSDSKCSAKPKIKPLFMLIFLLKKLQETNCVMVGSGKFASIIIELLESTFKQHSFISLKKFLTLISELKLLDLLNLIVANSESSIVVHKLNQYFPRWTPNYRASVEKDFCISNSKILGKVEESHTQCRRLILKLAVDKAFKLKYMSDQYSSDMSRLTNESKSFITEIVASMESHAGPSALETIASAEDRSYESDDLAVQLLLDYIQPTITDDALLKYLDDLGPTLNSEPKFCFTSCLLPFDTMSEEDSDQSQSEYESSQDVGDSLRSFADILPSDSPIKSKDVLMDLDHDI